MIRQWRVLFAIGTRPEMIKLAPVILQFRMDDRFATQVLFTAQHREMLDQMAEVFGISPDLDLNLMKVGQTPAEFLGDCIGRTAQVLREMRPDIIMVQGDTTTVLALALVGALERIPIGHVEAGLRTYNKSSPFPEELNRQIASVVATLHFAPTLRAAENLQSENVDPLHIHIVGNTVVDALDIVARETRETQLSTILDEFIIKYPAFILATAHRRENFGKPLLRICSSIKKIAITHPDVGIILPVHPNPNVQKVMFNEMQNIRNLLLCNPINYYSFVHLLKNCKLALTDSGGVQEEAPSFRVPVVLMREDTERPEGVVAGITKLVGTDESLIVSTVDEILGSKDFFSTVGCHNNPYGDGNASERIKDIILNFFSGV